MAEKPEKTASVRMDLGLPGMPEYLATVFATKDGPLGPPQGSPGIYRALLTLVRPELRPIGEYEVTAGEYIRGNSHLGMSKPFYEPPGNPEADQLHMDLNTDRGEKFKVIGRPNDAGFLGKLEVVDYEARDFDEAHEKAYRAAAVMLSDISVQLDIPLRVFQVDLTEVKAGSHRFSTVNPYPEVPCAIAPRMESTPDFRGYASMYREALTSNSFLYQYLCFYKITEGIRKRRVALEREAQRKGAKFVRPDEVVPRDEQDFVPWLETIFPMHPPWKDYHLAAIFRPEVRGRALADLVGDKAPLTALRDQIGHAFTASSGKQVVNLDEMGLHVQVQGWLPLLKCVARKMLRNEFPKEFLPYLRAGGTR